MMRPTGSLVVTALAAAVVLLTGCAPPADQGEAQQGAQPETTSSAESTQDQSEPATTKAKPAKPTTKRKPVRSGPALCKSKDLALSLGRGDAAAGTYWRPLRFTNKSKSTCEIQGFPGVSYVAGDDGHQVGAAAYRDGTKGKPVKLKPGGVAYAAVGFTQVRNYDPADCKPTAVRGLRVYPPQETASMFLRNSGTGCANADLDGNQLKVQTIRPGMG